MHLTGSSVSALSTWSTSKTPSRTSRLVSTASGAPRGRSGSSPATRMGARDTGSAKARRTSTALTKRIRPAERSFSCRTSSTSLESPSTSGRMSTSRRCCPISKASNQVDDQAQQHRLPEVGPADYRGWKRAVWTGHLLSFVYNADWQPTARQDDFGFQDRSMHDRFYVFYVL